MWQKIVISMALVAIVLSTEDRTEAQQIQACDAICSKQQQVDKFKSNDQKPFLDADLKRINSQRLHDALVELHLLIEQNLSFAKDLLSDVAVPQQFRGNFTEVMQKLYVKSETRKATDKQIGASPQA